MVPLLLLLLVSNACAERPYVPGRLRPSPERMQALLDAPVVSRAKPVITQFEVRVNPHVAFMGSSVWVTCFVPERYGTGRIRFGLEGVEMHEGPLDHSENRLLIQGLNCGTWHATCTILTTKGQESREVELEVRGGLCAGTR